MYHDSYNAYKKMYVLSFLYFKGFLYIHTARGNNSRVHPLLAAGESAEQASGVGFTPHRRLVCEVT